MASGSTQGEAEQEVDQATARAILQSCSEAKGDDGSVVRTYTQCAQTWPLADASAFDSFPSPLLHLLTFLLPAPIFTYDTPILAPS